MTVPELIRFQNVDLGYGGSVLLKNISLAFAPGEAIGLVGPNGAGKTTFLRAVLGLLAPLRGTIQRDRSRRFAYVPQVEDLNFFWPLTVREAVELSPRSRRPLGRMTAHEKDMVEASMDKTGVSKIGHLLLRDVSGGQRQRTILAQALSQEPDVLLLDEPTRGLDVVAERDLLSLIKGLKSHRFTILLVSHSLQIPLNLTDRLLLFNNGAVVDTNPKEILHTKKLEDIYGVPFLHHEHNGMRWVMALEGKS
jgi:ABC-type Mn2+/Zn2+ transport system ATPase subunit